MLLVAVSPCPLVAVLVIFPVFLIYIVMNITLYSLDLSENPVKNSHDTIIEGGIVIGLLVKRYFPSY